MSSLIDEYSKEELETIVNQSYSMKEVVRKLGYSAKGGQNNQTVKKRLKLFGISTEHFTHQKPLNRSFNNIFIENSTAAQQTLRRWYKKLGLSEYKCSICGLLPIWNNQPLTLILDHINGKNNDDRIQNLRWVCPNCNQQLPTTGYRNHPKIIKHNYCLDCGKEISKNARRCNACNNKIAKYNSTIAERNKKRAKYHITNRKELKDMIRTMKFSEIAQIFNVKISSIYDWCKVFNLPHTKTSIAQFSDNEWALI